MRWRGSCGSSLGSGRRGRRQRRRKGRRKSCASYATRTRRLSPFARLDPCPKALTRERLSRADPLDGWADQARAAALRRSMVRLEAECRAEGKAKEALDAQVADLEEECRAKARALTALEQVRTVPLISLVLLCDAGAPGSLHGSGLPAQAHRAGAASLEALEAEFAAAKQEVEAASRGAEALRSELDACRAELDRHRAAISRLRASLDERQR